MNMESQEFIALKRNLPLLVNVIKEDLISLGANLVASNVISHEFFSELVSNNVIPSTERAVRLMSAVTDKVRIDPRYFHKFTKTLQSDAALYGEMLAHLNETYQLSLIEQRVSGSSSEAVRRSDSYFNG